MTLTFADGSVRLTNEQTVALLKMFIGRPVLVHSDLPLKILDDLTEASLTIEDDGRSNFRIAARCWTFEMSDTKDGMFATLKEDGSIDVSAGFADVTLTLAKPGDEDLPDLHKRVGYTVADEEGVRDA